MTENKFSPEQSLQLIQSMLEKTRKGFSDSSFYLILWGWLIFIAAIAEYVLMVFCKYEQHYLVWNLMWLGAIASIVYGIRQERKEKVKTYMSDTMKYFGIGAGVTFTILAFIVGCYEMWQHSFPFYFLLYGFMSFISGAIIQYKPLRVAGIVCWAIAIASIFVKFDVQLLLMALAVLVAYIIPGYMLKARYKQQNL